MWPRSAKILSGFSLTIALCALGVILWMRFAQPAKPVYDPTLQPVTVAKAVRAKTTMIPGPEKIRIYDKVTISGKLNLPETTFPDPVIAVAVVEPHSGKTTAVTTMSEESGTSRIFLRREPQTFFDLKREFRLTGRMMFSGQNVAEVDLQAMPLRIGPIEVVAGVGMEVDRDNSDVRPRAFIGFEWRF